MDRDWREQQSKCRRIIKDEELDYLKRHCVGKFQHSTKESAEKEATRMSMKHSTAFGSYDCEFCGFYHIGREKNIVA